MKPIRTFSILLLLILLLLTGCSIDALAERGAGVLDIRRGHAQPYGRYVFQFRGELPLSA